MAFNPYFWVWVWAEACAYYVALGAMDEGADADLAASLWVINMMQEEV